ncbi:MAG: bifunctional nuclease family protein [Acidimicrobiales bacterium]
MEILGVRLELPANNPIALLREHAGLRRVLSIYIGPEEAKSIALAMEGIPTPRPMTHDLLRDVLIEIGATVHRVVITELRESTFYAEIVLEHAGQVHVVSSRPSDAMALAVRVQAPVFVEEAVLDVAAGPIPEEPEEQDHIVDEFRAFIDDVNPEDFAS